MHVVAIHGMEQGKETMADALALVLSVTLYEALTRLRTPGNGPLTVAVFAEKERAAQLAKRLQSAGFKASVLTADEIETEARAWIVRRFSLDEHELRVETDKGDSINISFKDLDLILCGIGIARSTSTEIVKDRSVSLGRAVLSGGMFITKTTKSVREVTNEERERFFNLYAGDGPTLVFRENTIIYDSLGPARKPSRAENFAYLLAELRRRCPSMQYDDRLLTKAGQAALIGPMLNPEEHLVIATALLAKALRGNSSDSASIE